MFTPEQVAETFAELGITHVVWLPDSALGPWEQALESSPAFQLVRVCREGEAWAIASGLHLGGMGGAGDGVGATVAQKHGHLLEIGRRLE